VVAVVVVAGGVFYLLRIAFNAESTKNIKKKKHFHRSLF